MELQAYIEAENKRLEKEACQFSAKEIVLKIEYKFCPNLTIIDTPGLISAAPGRKNQSLQVCMRMHFVGYRLRFLLDFGFWVWALFYFITLC